MAKPATVIDLTWSGDLVFAAAAPSDRRVVTDGRSHAGFSPVELLAVATAGCMAVDVVHILGKSRQPPTALRVRFSGVRAETEPHRFTAVTLTFDIEGTVSQPVVDRAVQLSREKYCSVWNSLREDITLDVVTSPPRSGPARDERHPACRFASPNGVGIRPVRIPRLAARPRRRGHDRGAHPRFAGRRPPTARRSRTGSR